jgi:hypothetical protein
MRFTLPDKRIPSHAPPPYLVVGRSSLIGLLFFIERMSIIVSFPQKSAGKIPEEY